MKCEPTNVPAAEEINVEAIKEKYRHERDRRIRKEGQDQYVKSGQAVDIDTSDPFTPFIERAPISEDLEVAILGAGWTGVMAGYHLKQAGVTEFRHIDHGGNFGGTWYWNRYPGIQCDNDAYCYLPLLEETGFMPSKKFSDGAEIYEYFQLIADKYEFREKALFHTLITALRWDESIKRWHISTDRGDTIRARFVIMAGGTLSTPKFPSIPGIEKFKGKMFHTSRWDYAYTGGEFENPALDKLAGKRVAILGTGATSIQALPFLAQYAKEVFVLQRTPSSVDERPNPPTDPEWVKTLKPGWQKERQTNFLQSAFIRVPPGEQDLICDVWTEINRNLDAEIKAEGRDDVSDEEFMARRDTMDFQVMERLRRRVDSIVEDKATAEALKPYYRFMCKRPLSNNDYYQTFNLPHVKLIDVAETQGLEQMTEKGFAQDGVEYEVDCMIFASGFEVTSDLKRRWGIDVVEGRDSVSIYDHWADGPSTFHGMMTRNFPNMFYTGYVQGGLNSTTTEQFGRQGYHIAHIISAAMKRNAVVVEPSKEGQEEYVRHFEEVEVDQSEFQRQCTPSYFNNEGEDTPRWALFRGYGLGWDAFQQLLQDWRDKDDLEGLILETDDK